MLAVIVLDDLLLVAENKRGHSRKWRGKNRLADKAAKQVAEELGGAGGALLRLLCSRECPELTSTLPQYTLAQDQLAETERPPKVKRVCGTLTARLLVPEALATSLVSQVIIRLPTGK